MENAIVPVFLKLIDSLDSDES
ncbi:DNA topoisomerase IV subunit A [unidentified eubacterium SCB49]|nr:DNA topoisomerase IV subunit A [unidentified eubacterium SCB49]